MKHLELQALRQLFFMTVDEAATYISGDSDITKWQHWEQGEIEIPDFICNNLTNNEQ